MEVIYVNTDVTENIQRINDIQHELIRLTAQKAQSQTNIT